MDTVIPLRTDKQAQRAAESISRALGEEGLHECVIRPVKKHRTSDQNSMYHALVNQVSDQTGHSHTAMHEYFKSEFLGYQNFEVNGRILSRPRSTTGLTTKEFSDYVEQVMAWCAEQFSITLNGES